MQRLSADETKQCIYVSEHTFENGLPNIQEVLSLITDNGNYVVSGLSQSLMLQGVGELDLQIDRLLGYSVSGHAIVMLSHCKNFLEKYLQRDIRLEKRIINIAGETTPLPQILLAKSKEECFGPYEKNIQGLFSRLERITDDEISAHPSITVISTFSSAFFRNSMYAITQSGGVYDTLIKKYSDLSAATEKAYGTDGEWSWLLDLTKNHSTFSKLIVSQFGSTEHLVGNLGEVLDAGDNNQLWLLWLALKVFGTGNKYLSYVLSHTKSSNALMHHVYQDLLEINHDDDRFEDYYRERKQLLSRLPENLPEIAAYCSSVGRHGRDAVFYLTDSSEDEEFTFMETIDHYDWTDEELTQAIEHAFPLLAQYMKDFVFDALNTKLSEKDALFREVLTDYWFECQNTVLKSSMSTDFGQYLQFWKEKYESVPFSGLFH